MKITMITQYYKPEMGAPQNRLYEMCTGLKNLGADISVITGMPNYPTGKIFDEYKKKLYCTEFIDGLEVKRYWLFASNSKKFLPRIWNMVTFSFSTLFSLCYLIKRKNDYIIVETPPLLLCVTALILSKLTGAKLILNVSDLWPLSMKEIGAISGDSLIYKLLERLELFLYKHSLFCMGQSQEIVDYIACHGAKDTYLFRNGVDPDRFVNNNSLHCRENADKMKIIYTGLLGTAQGIAEICSNINFSELGTEFHIYGAGGEKEQIEQFIKANPNNGIYYHGKVTREEIPNVLGQSDCTLIPLVSHIYGAVPSKIYESMAAGLPILFCGEGEGRRIVEDNNLGWVSDSRDYEKLKENILMISTQKEDWIEKKKNCVSCAKNKFNRPKQVSALFDFLNKKLNLNGNM